MLSNEPAVIVGSLTALVGAVAVLLRSFGVNLTDDQEKAVLGVLVIVGPLAAGFITRQWVTPTAKAQDVIDAAYVAQPGSDPKPTL